MKYKKLKTRNKTTLMKGQERNDKNKKKKGKTREAIQ